MKVLRRFYGRSSILISRSPSLLVDENVKNALTNLAGMKMILFPFVKLQLSGHQIEEPEILNVLPPNGRFISFALHRKSLL